MPDKTLISFDYAIKYLLRSKGDYDIIEGFISALLGTLGYAPVKINALIESESNREDQGLKRSVADLVVEDASGNKYIVEIERAFTTNFMHKACFNSSRLVVDSLGNAEDYRSIKKVFHVSLLYSGPTSMTKPIYHGKTIVHEVDTEHPVHFKIFNQGLVKFEYDNIFPEYIFISVPMFNDVVKQEIDEWLYMLKHSDVKASFKSPYMAKIKQRLLLLQLPDKERLEYQQYLKQAIQYEDNFESAEAKGEAKGLAKGKVEVARAMLAKNMTLDLISEITGLSIQEIEKLKQLWPAN